jgi:hypothetical protein
MGKDRIRDLNFEYGFSSLFLQHIHDAPVSTVADRSYSYIMIQWSKTGRLREIAFRPFVPTHGFWMAVLPTMREQIGL